MSWLIPSALGLTAVGIVVAVALHFIARSRPIAEALPTARFVPRRPIEARTRSLAPSDLLLLLLRVAALTAIGAAVGGPTFRANGRVTRLFVVDRSRAVASIAEARDSVRRLARSADALVVFDSATTRAATIAPLDTARVSSARGSLSAAIAAATRAAVTMSAQADSIELVLVSPLAREEVDEATARLRAAWPGRIRIVTTRAAVSDTTPLRIDAGANHDDLVVAGLALMGALDPAGAVRLVRGRAGASDSAWARGRGHVLLHWPASDSAAMWPRRATIDAVGGVVSGDATLIARFPRLWVLTGQPVARWSDGEPAAVEHTIGDGCIRDVGVLVDDASDLALRAPFRAFARSLLAPCGGARDPSVVGPALHASLAGTGPLPVASDLRDRATEVSRWSSWLFGLAALLLIAELAIRRAQGRVT